MRGYDMSRYRPPGDPQPSLQQPPSSQAEGYSQIPKTHHKTMTLADHISVFKRNIDEYVLLPLIYQGVVC